MYVAGSYLYKLGQVFDKLRISERPQARYS